MIQAELVELEAIFDAWEQSLDYPAYKALAISYREYPISQEEYAKAYDFLTKSLVVTDTLPVLDLKTL